MGASRIDCFSDDATTIFGEKLREQVDIYVAKVADLSKTLAEEKTVEHHGRDAKSMKESMHKVEERLEFLTQGTTPRTNLEVMHEAVKLVAKKRKKVKRKAKEQLLAVEEGMVVQEGVLEQPQQRSKKDQTTDDLDLDEIQLKKKKRKKVEAEVSAADEPEPDEKPKKKKKKEPQVETEVSGVDEPKKKKKRKSQGTD